jgi:hypothetical protein
MVAAVALTAAGSLPWSLAGPGRLGRAARPSTGLLRNPDPGIDTLPAETGWTPNIPREDPDMIAAVPDEYADLHRVLTEAGYRPCYTTDPLGTWLGFVHDGLRLRIWHPEYNANGENTWVVQCEQPNDDDAQDQVAADAVPEQIIAAALALHPTHR